MDTKHVVVAYDFSAPADAALDRAVALASRAPEHALHFVTVLHPTRGLGLDADVEVDYRYAEKIQQDLLTRLTEIFAATAPEKEVHFFVHVLIGDAVAEILATAEDVGADLIVVGSHGRTGVRRMMLGSISESIVRGAGCAVIVARPKSYADVALEQVVDAHPGEGDHHPRSRAHRYSYSSSVIQARPPEWPLN